MFKHGLDVHNKITELFDRKEITKSLVHADKRKGERILEIYMDLLRLN